MVRSRGGGRGLYLKLVGLAFPLRLPCFLEGGKEGGGGEEGGEGGSRMSLNPPPAVRRNNRKGLYSTTCLEDKGGDSLQ